MGLPRPGLSVVRETLSWKHSASPSSSHLGGTQVFDRALLLGDGFDPQVRGLHLRGSARLFTAELDDCWRGKLISQPGFYLQSY